MDYEHDVIDGVEEIDLGEEKSKNQNVKGLLAKWENMFKNETQIPDMSSRMYIRRPSKPINEIYNPEEKKEVEKPREFVRRASNQSCKRPPRIGLVF